MTLKKSDIVQFSHRIGDSFQELNNIFAKKKKSAAEVQLRMYILNVF